MEDLKNILSDNLLFTGFGERDFYIFEKFADVLKKEFSDGEYIAKQGDLLTRAGIVLDGCVSEVIIDLDGHKNLINRYEKGACFGCDVLLGKGKKLTYFLETTKAAQILFLNINKEFLSCNEYNKTHFLFLKNVIEELNHREQKRIEKEICLSQRSIKNKLLCFLSEEKKRCGEGEIIINMSRQEMADYLHLDRSEMISVLSSMRREGIIAYKKNKFKISEEELINICGE